MDQTDGPGEEVKRSKPMDRIADAAKREQERVAKGEEFTCLLMVFSLLFVVTIAAAGRDSTLYASDAMIEHIRVLEEAFGPNLPQILRQLQEGVAIVGWRVVE